MSDSRIVTGLKNAKLLDEGTSQDISSENRHEFSDTKSLDSTSNNIAKNASEVIVPGESEVLKRLTQTHQLMKQLSMLLSKDIQDNESITRQLRRLQSYWRESIHPLIDAKKHISSELCQKLQVANAERKKLVDEVEQSLNSHAFEDQLTLLQRFTRQLESVNAEKRPNQEKATALKGHMEKLVVDILNQENPSTKSSDAAKGLVQQARNVIQTTNASVTYASDRTRSARSVESKKEVKISVHVAID